MGTARRYLRWSLLAVLLPVNAAAEEATARHLELEVHGRVAHAMLRDERAAWLSLSVPFERMAAPRAARERAPGEARDLRTARASAPAAHQLAAATLPPAASATEAQPSPDQPASSEERFGAAQLRSLVEFQQRALGRALSVAGLGSELERLNGLSTRARASALLPELRLRAQRNTDQALRWSPTNDDPYRISQADGAGLILEVAARFRLDRLVFASEELAIERLRAQQLSLREKMVERVQEAFAGLLRLHFEACSAPPDSLARVRARATTFELLAELDFLTAGWFSGQAARLSLDLWGSASAIWGECEPAGAPGPRALASGAAPSLPISVAKADNSE